MQKRWDTFNVGPECEFFLFHTDDDGIRPRFQMKVQDILILDLWTLVRMQDVIWC